MSEATTDDAVPRDAAADDPKLYFRQHVFCCVNARAPDHPRGSCSRRGSKDLRDYMKRRAKELKLGRVRINAAQCLDRCELGPTLVIYPEGVWYTVSSPEDVEEILQTHLVEGGRVARLLLERSQTRLRPEQRGPCSWSPEAPLGEASGPT